jgi:hypothetical protein
MPILYTFAPLFLVWPRDTFNLFGPCCETYTPISCHTKQGFKR